MPPLARAMWKKMFSQHGRSDDAALVAWDKIRSEWVRDSGSWIMKEDLPGYHESEDGRVRIWMGQDGDWVAPTFCTSRATKGSIFAVASPGSGGFTLASFNPAASSSIQGLYLGVVFSVFAFTGWEGAAPLAEESEGLRRNVTRGTIGSVLILGAFLVFMSWAFLIGLGTGNIQSILD